MGQKVSPIGLRVGVIRDWESRWYADKDYADLLLEDVKIREFLTKECKHASVSRIEIERSKNRVTVIIRTARPGVVIGTNGENIEQLKKKLEKMTGKNVYLNVVEIANPDLDARLVARSSLISSSSVRLSVRRRRRPSRERCAPVPRESRLPYPDVWAAQISPVPKDTAKVSFRCTRCVRTSTMHGKRQRRLTAVWASRSGSAAVKCSREKW